MPKHFFKRLTPDPKAMRKNPALRFLGVLLEDPNLFHLNRHSISVAFFVGFFVMFLPIPGQIPLAALGAFIFRCNLPIAITLVWASNPLTFPIIFFSTYLLGARILQTPPRDMSFSFSWEWFQTEFLLIWQPLLLGCILASMFFSCAAYLGVQWTWRWYAVKKWKKRRMARIQKRKHVNK